MTPSSTFERPSIYADRLDFALKNFVRIAWTSAAAERTWGPKLVRMSATVMYCEWMSVVFKLRRCALFHIHERDLERYSAGWVARGLSWKCLSEGPRTGTWWLDARLRGRAPSRTVVLGNTLDIIDFERAWEDQDHESMGRLLGYPSCCRSFFQEVAVSQSCIDTVWAMSDSNKHLHSHERSRTVDGPAVSNILLQSLGIRAVPHAPCSFACHATALFAHDLSLVARKVGLKKEYDLLLSILSWPAEWSGLHGIAEIKTPIVKICIPTDATGRKYTVRWNGTVIPEEGAKGLFFPFKVSGRAGTANALVWPTSSTDSLGSTDSPRGAC